MYHIFLYLNSPFAEKTLFRLQSPLISCIIHSRMEGYRSGHNGAVLKSECHFGNGHPKKSVFPRISGNQRKQNIGDFSPSFLSFSASLLRDDGLNIHSWRCTQVAEGSGLENREVGVENRRGGSNPSISATSEQSSLCSDFFCTHKTTLSAPCKPFTMASADDNFEL